MSKEQKNEQQFVKEITSMEENFPQWYTDIVLKAEMADYSPVRGCMVIRPYGFAVWSHIQEAADKRFKATGHKNAYFPMLIPEHLLEKEADHFEGFAPEVLWVTHGGDEELPERLFVRPTSETIINTMFAKWITTYRDLPLLVNQWCNVIRWEKTTRPFLRTAEFLWQEGHTCHETYDEAQKETLQMLEIYRQVAEDELAMPVLLGRKSPKERFAGADETYTMEAMMHDGKALQAGTSHNLGQNFSKMFDIEFQNRDGGISNVWTTSWGISTRLIGGIIMTHGDNRGLKMPPRVAPTQVIVIPVAQHKEEVLDKAYDIKEQLSSKFRADIDARDHYSPGWKFNEWEMKGVPLRLEIGPKDIEKEQVVLVRRDTHDKIFVPMAELEDTVARLLDEIHDNLFEMAKKRREENMHRVTDYEEFKKLMSEKNAFVKAMWCGDQDCEDQIKADTAATIRCLPFEHEQEKLSETCLCCGKPAKTMVYVAKAY
ncbi:MAG: proline--tRNA ligase [Tissierellia bacterium]|nr:proline--tRNA ligase [Tissierellia bacterium]